MRGKLPIPSLNALLMKNARIAGAKRISPPRERTGSTDFADVMHVTPGACIRVAFVDKGVTAHSESFLAGGKSESAHDAISTAATILALTSADIIICPENLRKIKDEFARRLQHSETEDAE
jgi:metal-dependent amidase/aminoacylase/carboxypeptidase family protein